MRRVLVTISNFSGALKYELARLANLRSFRGVALFALVGSAILTLPAARHMVGLAHPMPPAPPVPQLDLSQLSLSHTDSATATATPTATDSATATAISDSARATAWAAALLHQYSPVHGGGAWVVAGGVVGMVLPGAATACAAAWFGATSIEYEYRHGGGLLTFVLLPKRVSVLVAKAVVAACVGALLCVAATAVAYWTARLGFRIAKVDVALPSHLMLAGPDAVGLAAVGGALGVVGGAVLRVRVLATAAALIGCALVAAFLPHSTSLAIPYLAEAAQGTVRLVSGVTYTVAVDLLLALPLAALVLSGLVAVRRRRVV